MNLKNINRWIEQKKFTNFLLSVLIGLLVVAGIYLFFRPQLQALASVLGITSNQKENSVNIKSLSPIPTEEVLPSVIPTATPTVYIYKAPPPTINPDPIIDCNITKIGIIKLKRNQCSISFACEIETGKWYLYASKDKCTQDQNTYWSNYYKNNSGTYKYTAPTQNSGSELIDCTIDGQVVGKMTFSECSLQIQQHYQPGNMPTQAPTTQSQDALSQQFHDAVTACFNRMRASGIGGGTYSDQCYTNPNIGL